MEEILRIQYNDIPEVGDYIDFEYNYDGITYPVFIVYVNERYDRGEFEVSNNIEKIFEIFKGHFEVDFNSLNHFKVDYDLLNKRIELTVNHNGTFQNVNYNSPNDNLSAEVVMSTYDDNEVRVILKENPQVGDYIEFDYYPLYPDYSLTEPITIQFVENITTTGDVLIGSTLKETYENLSQKFNEYYNIDGEWETFLDRYDSMPVEYISFNIRAENLSILINLDYGYGDRILVETSNSTIADRKGGNHVLVQSPNFVYSPSSLSLRRVRFTFNLIGNPNDNDMLSFELSGNGITQLFVEKRFKNNPVVSHLDVKLGQSPEATATNLLNSLEQYNQPAWIEYNRIGTRVFLDIFDDEGINYTINSSTPNSIQATGPVIDGGEEGYTHTKYSIRCWEGIQGGAGSIQQTIGEPGYDWEVTKQLMRPDQVRTYLDFSPLVNANFRGNIASYLSTDKVSNTPPETVKWVTVKAQNKLGDLDRDSRIDTYIALDGWTTDGVQDIPRVLLGGAYIEEINNIKYDIIHRTIHRNSPCRIFYQTPKHIDVIVRSKRPDFRIDFTQGNPSRSSEYIKSVKLPYIDDNVMDLGNRIEVEFRYEHQLFPVYQMARQINSIIVERSRIRTKVIYEVIDECKYPVVSVVFKNRFGVLETMTFGKLSRNNLRTTRESNKFSVVDIDGVSSELSHSNRDFVVNGREEWILNSDFLPEYMNEPMEDLFLSKEIWIVDENNVATPVILKDRDLERKTRLNDGLINYTLTFENSHNKKYDLI